MDTDDDDLLRDLGVVVVTYRSAADVAVGLRALPTDALARTVVVDNASDDGTADAVRALSLPRVEVIENGANVGFGAACNVGIAALPPTRWLAVVNPDAAAGRDALVRLLRHLDEHPDVAMVAPRLVRAGRPLRSASPLPTVRSMVRYHLPRGTKRLLPAAPRVDETTGVVPMVEGACMVFDRGALSSIGGFDERYFLFFEEADLARRLAADGRAVALVTEATVEHGVGRSRDSTPMRSLPFLVESGVRYLRRWHGPASARAYATGARAAWRTARLLGQLDGASHRALLAALRRA